MSNPPITTATTTAPPPPPPSLPPLHHYYHHTQLLPTTTTPIRDYHKGNWTIQETLILITAKKLNDDYRTARATTTTPIAAGKLRWNWIEDYCWSQGCYRSQNQCNDKWDNLLRDYKKLRCYHQQPRSSSSSPSNASDSYWKMERHERKLNNLPSNMSREVYEALNEVVQRRSSYSTTNNNNNIPSTAAQSPTPQVTIQRTSPAAPTTEVSDQGVDSGETEEAEASDKREPKLKKIRRVGRRKIGSSIERSASKLAETLKNCDGMKEKRHQQVMEMEQRRLHIEETRNQVNTEGITTFLEAITNLSHAIHSIISNSTDQT